MNIPTFETIKIRFFGKRFSSRPSQTTAVFVSRSY